MIKVVSDTLHHSREPVLLKVLPACLHTCSSRPEGKRVSHVCKAALILILTSLSTMEAAEPEWFSQAVRCVVVDKTQQRLRVYENHDVIFESRISTGKNDASTPNGYFRVGSKSLMHYSSLYGRAPMPFSVQVYRNVFIHGYKTVPLYPASHGCIRLPLNGSNPAEQFYNLVDVGTPIQIVGHWKRNGQK